MDWKDPETWKFINSFSSWLAAMVTLFAVLVSLYLSRKGQKIELEVKASRGVLYSEEGTSTQDCVWVECTNTGRRTAVVNLVYWKTGIFKKKNFFWKIPVNPRSSPLPIPLLDGQHARWVMEVKEFSQSFEKILNKVQKSPLMARFLKIGVRSSTGDFFERRLQPSLRHYILDLINQRQD